MDFCIVTVKVLNSYEYLKMGDQVKEGETKMCELLDELKKIGYEEGLSAGIGQGVLDKTRVVAANMIKRGMADDDIRALAE